MLENLYLNVVRVLKNVILLVIGKQIQLFQAEEKVKAVWLLSQKENLAITFVFLCLIALLNQWK
ncbi:hypothetical protein HMPREF2737_04640 [Staphylococcus sp. HMSC069D12]|nr:hypothetical protein HMPREF2135_10975 [Staphylococcus haemolyticus DNF00585]OFL87783.1 hypothetical protein HMPREF2737_04640 [Staphylococcus sp. HMSC069D12]